MAVTAPMDTRTASFDRVRARVSPASLAASRRSLIAAVVYLRTLLPGVSFGDWAESELLLSRFGILHPTGYPLYSLLGKAFSLIPIASVAWRANALSATAAAAAVGVAVLIAVRLGVRPAIAMAAALGLAFTGTLWEEATFSEMNTLHLLLVALAPPSRAGLARRAADPRPGHRRPARRPVRLEPCARRSASSRSSSCSCWSMPATRSPRTRSCSRSRSRRSPSACSPTCTCPLRALAGPADVYGPLPHLERVLQPRQRRPCSAGTCTSSRSRAPRAAWAALPHVLDQLVALSDVVFVAAGHRRAGHPARRRSLVRVLLAVLAVVNVYIYANYLGDLPHYLLTTWLILAIGVAVGAEAVVRAAIVWVGDRAAAAPVRRLPAADRAARHELAGPRPVGQPRRREVHGRGLRGAAAERRPDHLLGRPDRVELRALQRGRPTRRRACAPTTPTPW